MFTFLIQQSLEHNIRTYLTEARKTNPTNYRVKTFDLFSNLQRQIDISIGSIPVGFIIPLHWDYTSPDYRRKRLVESVMSKSAGLCGRIPVALFNKTIGDLKKVGIIGTCKGGEEVFLSDAAWQLHERLKVASAQFDDNGGAA